MYKSYAATLTLACAAIAFTSGVANAEPFSGEYGGVQAGVVIFDEDRITIAGPSSGSSTEPTASLILGYRTPISGNSPIVVGIEGDLGAVTDSIDARFAVSGIAGYRIGESALAYGRVGYTSISGLPDTNGTGAQQALTLGGGIEFALSDRLNLRADYRHEDFGTLVNFTDNVIDLKAHEITAGLIYEF
ncbi:MAG: porin family protein [Novosphingobium sp.]|nr:porin family protein [Novosphingobium sp.]